MTSQAMLAAEQVLRTIARTVIDNERYFCELDAVVGDGDLGYSLARGFERLLEEWDELDRTEVSTLLTSAAKVLSGRIGGTSGPIWGTAFLRAGLTLRGASEPTGSDVTAALRRAIEGIMQRGNATLGDKTLLDSLVPAVDRLESRICDGDTLPNALAACAVTARNAAEATKGMLAKRGRASYAGERSRGSVDAGAVAVAVVFEALSNQWQPVMTTVEGGEQ